MKKAATIEVGNARGSTRGKACADGEFPILETKSGLLLKLKRREFAARSMAYCAAGEKAWFWRFGGGIELLFARIQAGWPRK